MNEDSNVDPLAMEWRAAPDVACPRCSGITWHLTLTEQRIHTFTGREETSLHSSGIDDDFVSLSCDTCEMSLRSEAKGNARWAMGYSEPGVRGVSEDIRLRLVAIAQHLIAVQDVPGWLSTHWADTM